MDQERQRSERPEVTAPRETTVLQAPLVITRVDGTPMFKFLERGPDGVEGHVDGLQLCDTQGVPRMALTLGLWNGPKLAMLLPNGEESLYLLGAEGTSERSDSTGIVMFDGKGTLRADLYADEDGGTLSLYRGDMRESERTVARVSSMPWAWWEWWEWWFRRPLRAIRWAASKWLRDCRTCAGCKRRLLDLASSTNQIREGQP